MDRKKMAIIGGVVLVIIAAIAVIAATGGGSKTKTASAPPATVPAVAGNLCPLTDTPAPGGTVPAREPLAIKIGNETTARPQSGLDEADVVYDTPAEGGIMRYVAVYQCQNATNIGPIRSVRWVDSHILSVFTHVALAFVGGINPNQENIANTPWIDNANEFLHGSAYHHDTARVAPDATYATTASLYGLFTTPHPAPTPIFTYTKSLPSGAKPASQLAINFSAGTDVEWEWNTATSLWDHYYSGTADVDALTNAPVSTTNIVVEVVKYTFGPYPESTGGSGDVESRVIGSGPGYIFRNGKEIPINWRRNTARSTTTYTDADGKKVGLAPGRTFVEIVLNSTYAYKGAFTITP